MCLVDEDGDDGLLGWSPVSNHTMTNEETMEMRKRVIMRRINMRREGNGDGGDEGIEMKMTMKLRLKMKMETS